MELTTDPLLSPRWLLVALTRNTNINLCIEMEAND